MPLSEEELRLLEQMERALVAEDPKLAHTLRGTALRRSARRRAVLGGAAFLVGVAVMMTGAVMRIPLVGIAGFVVMLASATMVVTSLRARSDSRAAGHPSHGFSVVDGGRSKRRGSGGSSSLMDRMEERWRRRRDENGGF